MRTRILLLGVCSAFLLPACESASAPPDDASTHADTSLPDVPLARPDIVSFTVSEHFIVTGASIDLVATFTGASATIDQGVGTVTSGATYSASPTEDTTYSLVVTGEDGTQSIATQSVRVFDAIFTVTTTASHGAGSLHEAVTAANVQDQRTLIRFSLPDDAIITQSTDTLVTTNGVVTVMGPGPELLTVSGEDVQRIWFVNGGTLRISGLTFTRGLGAGGNGGASVSGAGGGGAGMGGAFFVNAGNVSLTDVAFTHNVARGGNGGAVIPSGFANGGGGGGFGGHGANGSSAMAQAGGDGGASGLLGGAPGTHNMIGGDGAGGKGAGAGAPENGGPAGFGGGGGGRGGFAGSGAGGFGGAAGGGVNPVSGTFGGTTVGIPAGGGAGLGGAIFVRAGTVSLVRATFTDNQAVGGLTGGGTSTNGQAKAGALFTLVPSVTLTDVTYEGSVAADAAGTETDSVDVFLTP